MMEVQQRLMTSLWTSSLDAPISLSHPLTYADRLRIRQPGDTSFALGPHIDGGSVERWEKEGYGRGGVYDKIFEGDWEKYDPFDATTRIDAVNNLYDGPGACSMLRLWQGWLSMSECGPLEGTLLVNPLIKLSTAYLLLRPFFTPISRSRHEGFLNASNWMLLDEANMTTELQGASLEHRQELNEELHPHLALGQTMVHIPKMHPGDFVAWHCDCTSPACSYQLRGANLPQQQSTQSTSSILAKMTRVSCTFLSVRSLNLMRNIWLASVTPFDGALQLPTFLVTRASLSMLTGRPRTCCRPAQTPWADKHLG